MTETEALRVLRKAKCRHHPNLKQHGALVSFSQHAQCFVDALVEAGVVEREEA